MNAKRRFGVVDVAIVGGGFAGLVAARELTERGYSTVILEARDRLGGRTLTREWHGYPIDLGGQWIHWLQPHVWAEVTRYGLEIFEREPAERVWWITQSGVSSGSLGEFYAVYKESWIRMFAEATSLFPRPHEPLKAIEKLRLVDRITIGERIGQLGLEGAARDIVRAFASVQFNAPADDGALTQIMRRLALVGGSSDLLAQAVAQYKVLGGSKILLDAIAARCGAEIELSTVVSRIAVQADGVELSTSKGTRVRARATIVTVPIGALGDIEFSPLLSKGKQAMVREKQMSRGAMFWLRLSQVPKNFLLLAPPENPLSFVRFDGERDGIVLANAFSPDAARIDTSDGNALEDAVRRWLPDARLIDYISHDWVADPYAGQTWAMLKPGQLTAHFADLQRAEGAIHFAGADYASGWFGFIDGAIQSALAAARKVAALLLAA